MSLGALNYFKQRSILLGRQNNWTLLHSILVLMCTKSSDNKTHLHYPRKRGNTVTYLEITPSASKVQVSVINKHFYLIPEWIHNLKNIFKKMEASRQDNMLSILRCTLNFTNSFQEHIFLIDFLGLFLRYSSHRTFRWEIKLKYHLWYKLLCLWRQDWVYFCFVSYKEFSLRKLLQKWRKYVNILSLEPEPSYFNNWWKI